MQVKADIKRLHSNRGGKYLSKEFVNHLEKRGTESKLTVHDTPEENGVSERLNGVLLEKTQAMFHASSLPNFLWGEAVCHAVWLRNRSSMCAIPEGKTPYEVFLGKKPDLSNVHEWGTLCYVHQPKSQGQSKLDGRVKVGRWIGVDDKSQGCHIYWPEERRVTVGCSVVFQKPEVMVMVDGISSRDLDKIEGEKTASQPSGSKPSGNLPQVQPSNVQLSIKSEPWSPTLPFLISEALPSPSQPMMSLQALYAQNSRIYPFITQYLRNDAIIILTHSIIPRIFTVYATNI